MLERGIETNVGGIRGGRAAAVVKLIVVLLTVMLSEVVNRGGSPNRCRVGTASCEQVEPVMFTAVVVGGSGTAADETVVASVAAAAVPRRSLAVAPVIATVETLDFAE